MLSEFLTTHRTTIITKSRAKVAARAAPRATSAELEVGIPLFLDQLIATLHVEEKTSGSPSDKQIGLSAAEHGRALQEHGFSAAQVIHDYGDVCQGITELAVELDAPITTDEFRTLNRCLDEAMAEAVSEFGRRRELAASDDKSEENLRQGLFSHELRDLVDSCILAVDVIKDGRVGAGGSTAGALRHNLERLRVLLDRSLAGDAEAMKSN